MNTKPNNQLTIYLLLSFLISWMIWIPVALTGKDYQSSPFLLAGTLIGAFGPGLAAIITNYIGRDWEKISDFRQRIYDFHRIRPAWILIIFALWPVLHGLAIGITKLLGAPIPESAFLQEILNKPGTIPLVIFLYFLQAGVEEIGWRGYLQEELGNKMGSSRSSLLVGLIHTFWHLPLFWVVGTNQIKMGFGNDFLVFIAFVISSSVISSWCYYGNNHSILAITLLHTTSNLSFDIFAYAPGSVKHLITTLLMVLVAALLLIFYLDWKKTDPQVMD
ncbi:MAG: CPBP family intramembrane metalloprotease [Anaerolineales bacterium]|nr:MAG: CPBP family intramembrane metalloprotease [Anaerolineales bacterium]